MGCLHLLTGNAHGFRWKPLRTGWYRKDGVCQGVGPGLRSAGEIAAHDTPAKLDKI